jgi:hypothetical protein
VAIATITPVTPGSAETVRLTCMSFTESAYTPERSETERVPSVTIEPGGSAESVTRTTVPRDVSAVKYHPERAITI